MDLPFKVDFPKLSHWDLLKIVLPVIPAIAISGGLLIVGVRLNNISTVTGLGYKTSMLFASLASYCLGMGTMTISEVGFSIVFNLFKNRKGIVVPSDRYWRQLAIEYLGPNLVPRRDSNESLLDAITYLRGIGLLDATTKAFSVEKIDELKQKHLQMVNTLENSLGLDEVQRLSFRSAADALGQDILMADERQLLECKP